MCEKCGIETAKWDTKAEATIAWNTRPSPWISVEDMPECFIQPYRPSEEEWKAKFLTVEYCAKEITIHSTEEIWLSEDSEVEFYQPIALPTD